MERLYFGARARRRARLKRLVRAITYVSLAAVLLGIPGSRLAVDFINSLMTPRSSGVVTAGPVETTESAASTLRFQRQVFRARPTPRRHDTTPDSITEIILGAASEHGLDGDYLLSVAGCESGLDPEAVNPAGYYGLFQFDEQTWAAFGYGSIYDPVAQAYTAAELLAAGQTSRWPNCA